MLLVVVRRCLAARVVASPELRVYVCDVIWQQSPLGLIASSPII